MKIKSLHTNIRMVIMFLLMIGTAITSVSAADKVSLLSNGDFEMADDTNEWPKGWPKLEKGTYWEKDETNGNRFLRLKSETADVMFMLYKEINIPEGVRALELKWKHRLNDFQKGDKDWFDARIMLEFLNAERNKVGPSPSAPSYRKDIVDWREESRKFLVPEGAKILKFMPALFQVKSGTWDLDDFELNSIDAEPLIQEAREREAKRAEEFAKRAKARQEKAAKVLELHGDLIVDGGYDNTGKKRKFLVQEENNSFLRLVSTEPNKTVLDYREIDLPANVEALELKWRQRVSNFKKGSKPWFDARIMIEFKDAAGKVLKKKPSAPYSQRNTDGWVDKSTAFLVPKEAVSVVLMPALMEVKSGTFDLDDLSLKPIDAAPLIARQKEAEERATKARVPAEEEKRDQWPPMLKAKGNRLVTIEDEKEVWLQGLNVPSLEWSMQGEQVHKSVVVAIDEWKSNVIRLPIREDYWFGKESGDEGVAYRAIVDQAVTLAANRGAYLVLDLHRYRAPRREHVDFWKDAARRYKNHPAVIFDLLNEPHGVTWEVWRDGGFVEEKRKDGDEDAFLTEEEKLHNKHGYQSPGMQALLDVVRSTGAKNLVLVGGLDYAYQLDGIVNGFGLKDEEGNGIIYACHIYPWKKDWQKYLLNAAAKYPVLLGEVGADARKMDFMPHEYQEDAETWVPSILGLIQEHRLHWTGWCFHPSASPRMLVNWDYEPTEFWGKPAKEALAGKKWLLDKLR